MIMFKESPMISVTGFGDEFDTQVAAGEIKRQLRAGLGLEAGMAALIDYAESLRPSLAWDQIRALDFRADAEVLRRRILQDTAKGLISQEIRSLSFSSGVYWPDQLRSVDTQSEKETEQDSCLGISGTNYWTEAIKVEALQSARIILGVRTYDKDMTTETARGAEAHEFLERAFLGLTLAEWCRSAEGRSLLLGDAEEREIYWDITDPDSAIGRITSDEFHPDAETADPRFWAGFGTEERRNSDQLIKMSLAEDFGIDPRQITSTFLTFCISMPWEFGYCESYYPGDITGHAVIPLFENPKGSALFVARTNGVMAGGPILSHLADLFTLSYEPRIRDGQEIRAGEMIARISGDMKRLLAMERTALNFLQRLSGVATMTAKFVAEVAGTKAVILDTRKTTPGWRALEKYAVRCGGGTNHRTGLYDAILIKDNHLAWLENSGDPIGQAVAAAQQCYGMRFAQNRDLPPDRKKFIEVEVDTLEQLDRALEVGPDIILVDNLGPEKLAEAVRRRNERAPGVLLEASGGVNLSTVRALAETGVDRISVGALTHSAPALDIGLDFDRVIAS
jgi:nicotinate-nucleotide pyrophosphorylase (carboxylating)